jgi:hypothetical protein
MPRRTPLPKALHARPFAVREALALGVTPDRLRSADLDAPFHGVRGPRLEHGDILVRASQYAPRMRHDHAFSHSTAAALWGIPLPRTSSSRVDVAAPLPARAPEVRGVHGRQLTLRAEDVCRRNGVRVTAPALTWCSLGSILSVGDLVAAGDYLVTQRLANMDSLADTIAERSGMRGLSRVRDALPLLREGAMSRPESLVRVLVTAVGMPEPAINLRIRDRGVFLAMPDISWPAYRVAVEYEGDYHRTERGQFHRDIQRIERMVDAGWIVVRVSARALFDEPQALVERIARRLASRGWQGRLDLRKVGHFAR